MGKHYNNYYKEKAEKVEEINETSELVEETDEMSEPVEEYDVDESSEPVEEIEKPTSYFGTVVDCVNLRVRSEKNTGDNVVTTIKQGTKVEITSLDEGSDFYGVRLDDGRTGYCMKKFIEI